jgi:hypothetical protein
VWKKITQERRNIKRKREKRNKSRQKIKEEKNVHVNIIKERKRKGERNEVRKI